MSTRTDYFGTFLDTLNRPDPQAMKAKLESLEERTIRLAQENGQLLSENRRLQSQNAEAMKQNERLTNLLELALQEKGIGTKVSAVA